MAVVQETGVRPPQAKPPVKVGGAETPAPKMVKKVMKKGQLKKGPKKLVPGAGVKFRARVCEFMCACV